MGLSNEIKAREAKAVPTSAPAPAVAPMAKDVSGAKPKKSEAFRNSGAALRRQMSDNDKEIEGSKSDTIEFLSCLGNPAINQPRKSKNEDIPCMPVIGYAFKLLEDTEVPYAPIKPNYKSPVDCEPVEWQSGKAGETIYLNNMEMAYLISKLQYAGNFSGNGTVVRISPKFSSKRPEPLPVLLKEGTGSIKEQMMAIAEEVGKTPAGDPIWKAKEGFEKFAPLWVKKSAGARGSANTSKGTDDSAKDLAAAFRNYFASK